ncbi:Glycosyl hydrolases family 43 [Microbacterium sp. cf046]|uniref:family 43 glycosylhydrolase n=1 Tax=Microbacterium sp. cf046 TaxID=1761803 RepID=UPI0008E7F4D8|nr:family 43 glycosylhydrolase [Microbacterium sp. cf046]SFS13929.1 Glycosyl hydrolases family 43 [Microbacterium sp. cf046]
MTPQPVELYRDPVYDGATDPTVVITDGVWWMFYTQRRATHPDAGPGVAWVHGSRIGVAQSPDGVAWTYAGTLEPYAAGLTLRAGPPPGEVDVTHWAPEVIHDGERWRMYLTEIDGIPDRWPGFARTIVEYVSDDLRGWRRRGPISLSSDRVIDAAVARCPDGRWRLWFKDEAADSVTKVAASTDLETWRVEGTAIGGRAHEGPYVLELGGSWWMIVDEWRGMGVYRSADAVAWTRQGGPDAVILGAADVPATGFGHHGAAVRDGEDVWFYYFGHPRRAAVPPPEQDVIDDRRCAVYRARLTVVDGELRCAP